MNTQCDEDFLSEGQARWRAEQTSMVAEREASMRTILFDRRSGCVAITWLGPIAGDDLREAMQEGLRLQWLHGVGRWLLDMRRAPAMSQEDRDWFERWLHNAPRFGVEQIGVVLPENVVTRKQILPLQEANSHVITFRRT